VAGLPAGEHKLEASRDGFQTARLDIELSAGQTRFQTIKLNPTNASVSLGGDWIEEAPAPNRNYLGFVLTSPAIASSPGSNTMRSATGIRNPSNDAGFTFAGMRGRNNGIPIDGADNRDETTGGKRVAIGLDHRPGDDAGVPSIGHERQCGVRTGGGRAGQCRDAIRGKPLTERRPCAMVNFWGLPPKIGGGIR
jgi:hypothetical protein